MRCHDIKHLSLHKQLGAERLLGAQDIIEEKLYIIDLSKGPSSLVTIDTGVSVGVTADIEGSNQVILAGAKDGITKFDLQTAKHDYIRKYWDEDSPGKAKR